MAQVICKRCGHHNSEGANFCSSCGEPLSGDDHQTLNIPRVEAEPNTTEHDATIDGEALLAERVSLGDAPGALLIRSGPGEGSTFLLDSEVTTVGRHPESEVFLDDITVSRRHAEIIRDVNGFLVRDVGSLNGTYLNRERVEESPLGSGDELQIGRFKLVLFCNSEQDVS